MTIRLAYMETLAERLRYALNETGRKQVELVAACGVKPASVSDWLSGKTKSLKAVTARRAASFLGVSLLWLTEGRGPVWTNDAGAKSPLQPTEPGPEFFAVRCAQLKLQAGASGYAIDYLNDDSLPIFFRSDWFAQKGCKPDRCVALRVAGKSMEPNMYDGDILIIDLDATRPIDGLPFAANYEGEAVIKRLRRDAGEWWLSSDNPDKSRYRDKKCTEDVTIIGQVIYRQTEHV